MAKAFGKKKPPVEEVEAEEVEVEESEAGEAEEGEEGEKAPIVRERKWNYGITMESKVKRVAGTECPGSVSDSWDATANSPNVERFAELAGSDWRHALRVMMRAGCIQLITAGETFPKPYDKAAAEEARKEREARKAERDAAKAEEAGEEEEVEEEEAPPPKKPAKKAPKRK